MTLDFFRHHIKIKMKYQKVINLLDTTSDNMPRFIKEKWIEVYDQSGRS